MIDSLPPGLSLVRVTNSFDVETTPKGLRRAHRIATGVWGLLVVNAGSLLFVFEPNDAGPGTSHRVKAGEQVVIPPQVLHHVEPDSDAVFCVEFHQ